MRAPIDIRAVAIVLAVAVGGSGCAASAADLAECEIGAAWADCGGSGSPVLACVEDGDRAFELASSTGACRWFVGGRVPAGHRRSRCRPEDPCCERDGEWPFPAGDGSARGADAMIFGWGAAPWDRSRAADLTVEVGGEITDSPGLECDRTVATVCDAGVREGAQLRYTALGPLVVSLAVPRDFMGSDVVLEVVPQEDGTLRARVCSVPITDFFADRCSDARGPRCAVSGSVRLTAWPPAAIETGGPGVEVEATFEDGSTLRWVL